LSVLLALTRYGTQVQKGDKMNNIIRLLANGMLRKIEDDHKVSIMSTREKTENNQWIEGKESCHIGQEKFVKKQTHRSVKL
jgi:hypothetical protein